MGWSVHEGADDCGGEDDIRNDVVIGEERPG